MQLIFIAEFFSKSNIINIKSSFHIIIKRLAGATLIVFANKQDIPGSLSSDEISQVYASYVCI